MLYLWSLSVGLVFENNCNFLLSETGYSAKNWCLLKERKVTLIFSLFFFILFPSSSFSLGCVALFLIFGTFFFLFHSMFMNSDTSFSAFLLSELFFSFSPKQQQQHEDQSDYRNPVAFFFLSINEIRLILVCRQEIRWKRHPCIFIIKPIFLDKMSAAAMQLVATKCPTDELSFTNCAIVNEKDVDPRRIR